MERSFLPSHLVIGHKRNIPFWEKMETVLIGCLLAVFGPFTCHPSNDLRFFRLLPNEMPARYLPWQERALAAPSIACRAIPNWREGVGGVCNFLANRMGDA